MYKLLIISLGLCSFLEGAQCYDEPLSCQEWSYFGPLCQHYVAGRREKPDAVYEILKTYVKPHASILDLGSGTGISTRQLWRNGFKQVIGVDRDSLMIKEAQAANQGNCKIKYIQADISKGLPFPDEEFDVVTAASAFHWFSNPSSIKEAARILKPNGYYFVIGARERKILPKNTEGIKANIRQILKEAGVPPKPYKHAMSTAVALEGQGFKIIVDTQVHFAYDFTKQEYLERIQSQSSWNLVKESQREHILKKIDSYLDSVLNDQGKIRQEGELSVVLAQKPAKK